MRKLLLFFVFFFLFPRPIFASKSISGLTLCVEGNPSDNRFSQFIGRALKTDPSCDQTHLNVYGWTDSQNYKKIRDPIGIKITGLVDDKETIDLFFDTVFDHCRYPLLFRELAPQSKDSYFTALLSEATFFYIKGTRYINIGNINNSNEFRKKLFYAYLNFLSNSPIIYYPVLHDANGDPWIKFQKDGKFENPPDVIGLIGNNFALFANISNKRQTFNLREFSYVNNNYLYSNQKPSPIKFNSNNSLTLETDEVIFITNINIPTSSSSRTPTPTPTLQITPTSGFPTAAKTPAPTITNTPVPTITNTPAPTIFDNKINPGQKVGFQSDQTPLINSFQYLLFSFVYIMVIHFAFGIKKEFSLYLMIFGFVIASVIGWWFKSWEIGLVLGIIFSLIFY